LTDVVSTEKLADQTEAKTAQLVIFFKAVCLIQNTAKKTYDETT